MSKVWKDEYYPSVLQSRFAVLRLKAVLSKQIAQKRHEVLINYLFYFLSFGVPPSYTEGSHSFHLRVKK